MAFMKDLTPYTGKEDSESWLDSYESVAKVEKWTTSQMLGFVNFKTQKEH